MISGDFRIILGLRESSKTAKNAKTTKPTIVRIKTRKRILPTRTTPYMAGIGGERTPRCDHGTPAPLQAHGDGFRHAEPAPLASDEREEADDGERKQQRGRPHRGQPPSTSRV